MSAPPQKLGFFESPLAESFGSQRKSRFITIALGAIVRLGFAAAVVIAGIYYYRQEQTVQLTVVDPTGYNDCMPLGSPGLLGITNTSTRYGPITWENTLFGAIPFQYTTPEGCRRWFNESIRMPLTGSALGHAANIFPQVEFKSAFCALDPTHQPAFEAFLRSGSQDYDTLQDLVSRPGSACLRPRCVDDNNPRTGLNLEPGNLQYIMTELGVDCAGAGGGNSATAIRDVYLDIDHSIVAFDPFTPTAAYEVSYKCYNNAGTTFIGERSIHTNYTGPCSSAAAQINFAKPLAKFCDSFQAMNAPYLCTQVVKRGVADIINLSFAAGSSVALGLVLLLEKLHGWINPPVGGKSTSSTELA